MGIAPGARRYRARIITGTDATPVELAGEELSTDVPAWVPTTVDFAPNTRVAIQVMHSEVTAQVFRATAAYCEHP